MSRKKIGMIGLGIMGGAMAKQLIDASYAVSGYDIDQNCLERHRQNGGEVSENIELLMFDVDIVIISLATSQALLDTAEKIAFALSKDPSKKPIVIETSTLPLGDKESFQRIVQAQGIQILDCPISGTAVRLSERAWTFFCSGPLSAYEETLEIYKLFTDNFPYVGEYGSGTKMKYVANHLVAIYNVAYAESTTLAKKLGLNPQDVLDLFGNSPVIGTGVMRLRVKMMVDDTFVPPTMKVQVWQKDMQVIGDAAKAVNCPTPIFNACAGIYTAAMAQGLAMEDTASVARVYAGMAGLLGLV